MDKWAEKMAGLAKGNVSYQKLKESAETYLATLTALAARIKVEEQDLSPVALIKRFNFEDLNSVENIYRLYNKSYVLKGKYMREIETATHAFTTVYNNFLNRTMQLALVGENGEIYAITEMAEKKLYESATSRQIAFDKLDLNTDATKLMHEKETEELYRRRKQIYQTAIRRYEETSLERTDGRQGKWHLMYWHNSNGGREYAFVQNKGMLGEAFVRLVMNADKDFQTLPEDYASRTAYTRLWEGTLENDWMNEALGADVQTSLKSEDLLDIILNPYQISVKTAGGNFASVRPYIKVADIIVKHSNLSSDDLAQKIKHAFTSHGQNPQEKLFQKGTEVAVKEAFSEKYLGSKLHLSIEI